MLEISGLRAGYGDILVLDGVDLVVPSGNVACVVGPNGCGKSTLLKAISGLIPKRAGRVLLFGDDVTAMKPETLIAHRIALVLERRRLFTEMTVRENLELGVYARPLRRLLGQRLDYVRDLFPLLAKRERQVAGSLSGGEQQMVAIARGLMSDPRLLLLDEPFLGLSPQMARFVAEIIRTVGEAGVTTIFNEQNVPLGFSISDVACVMETGRVVLSGKAAELLEHPDIISVYLGQDAA